MHELIVKNDAPSSYIKIVILTFLELIDKFLAHT